MANDYSASTSYLAPSKQEIDSQLAWAKVLGFTDIKYFWKDIHRRFCGVSQSFLEYYGFESADELIGKTDEEVGWHVANNRFRNDESEVLEAGKCTINISGNCLINGVLHKIYTNKKPIYRDGGIIGIFGFFVDAENIEPEIRNQYLVTIDPITGLCNARGLIESYNYFREEYAVSQRDVFAIGIQTEGYEAHRKKYGERAGSHYLRAVTDVILKHFKSKAVISHLQTNKFMMLSNYRDPAMLQSDLKELKEDLAGITEAGGDPCSCDPYIVTYNAAAPRELEEAIGAFWSTSTRQDVLVLQQMIEILGAEYDGLIYLNLDTLDINHYKHSSILGDLSVLNFGEFSNAFSGYLKQCVGEDVPAALSDMTTADGIRALLSHTKCFTQNYKNTDGHNCAVRLMKLEAADQTAQHIVMGFIDQDRTDN